MGLAPGLPGVHGGLLRRQLAQVERLRGVEEASPSVPGLRASRQRRGRLCGRECVRLLGRPKGGGGRLRACQAPQSQPVIPSA